MNNPWRSIPPSDHYIHHKFINPTETPMIAKGFSFSKVFGDMLTRPKLSRPPYPLPAVKQDLKNLNSEEPVIIWFGHSSYLIHCRGYNILVDPVFSGHASPVRGIIRAFPGSDLYKPADMPVIDLMLITHNHYDHLDKSTLRKLKGQTKKYVVSLGVGRDLADCGIDRSLITELDWWENISPAENIELTAAPARHFSGRGFVRGGSLWSAFALKLFGYSIYIGGDSGYDEFFNEIGRRLGPFDLAILECGQYNLAWPNIHMMPEETALAAVQLKSRWLMPVHWGKFTLANHIWTEPVTRLLVAAKDLNLPVTTPKIGESIILNQSYPTQKWWEHLLENSGRGG
ncbi:MAG: MBL fold metallo-hydrolase [Chitinophagaceae bacterium]